MPERLNINSHGELADFFGFVVLCYPDRFPGDTGSERLPSNMQEAFEDLLNGLRTVELKSRNKLKIRRLREMVIEAEELHNAGDEFGCTRVLQRARHAMRRSGKAAEALMAYGPRPKDEVDRLVHDSIVEAKEGIRGTGDLMPFARILLNNGNTEQVETMGDNQDIYKAVNERIADIRAVAVTVKGQHKAPDHTKQLAVSLIDYDSIIIDCDHRDSEAYTFVLPYRFTSSGFEDVRTHKSPQIKARRKFFSE